MPLSVRCDRCSKSQSVPDSLVGEPIICSYCGRQLIVSPDAPLMPPPLPGTSAAMSTAAPSQPAPATSTSARPAPTRPLPRGAGPMPAARSAGASPAALPPTAPPPAPPPLAPPRRTEVTTTDASVATYGSKARVQSSSLGLWIIAGGLVVAILVGLMVMIIVQQLKKNPHPSEVAGQFEPEPKALAFLGPRQAGLGYSLQLPADFVPAAAPATDGLPAGTQAAAWAAIPESNGAGSEFRMWVIPQNLDIDRELQKLNGLGTMYEHPVAIQNKVPYQRIGKDLVAVRALTEGTDRTNVRRGVIYLIADGRKTIIALGMGAGAKAGQFQALLNTAICTLDRAGTTPAPSATATKAAVAPTEAKAPPAPEAKKAPAEPTAPASKKPARK